MIKYFMFLIQSIKIAIQRLLIYRINYAFVVIFETLNCLSYMLFLEVIFANISSIAGWEKYELFVLYGSFFIQMQLFMAFCISGIESLPNKINQGNMDYILLKPINSRFLSVFEQFNFQQIFTLIVAIYMVVYGLLKLEIAPSFQNILFYFILLFLGFSILINLFSIMITFSFFFIKIDKFVEFIFIFIGYCKEPKQIFKGFIQKIFMLIIPIILVTNPAVSNILRGHESSDLFLTACYAILLYIIAELFWRISVNRYQSASS